MVRRGSQTKANKAYYEANKERLHEKTLEWMRKNPERRREMSRQSYARCKARHKANMAEYHGRNGERRAVQTILRAALRDGRLTRPETCQFCGKKCKPDGHHPDYTKPLDVIWLCRVCHKELHAKERPENTKSADK